MAEVMILAAGLGTRMKSSRAKVLHELGGRPLITYAVGTAFGINPDRLFIVVGHQAEEVKESVMAYCERLTVSGAVLPQIDFILQAEQRGTGHAVMAARDALKSSASSGGGPLVVMVGDGPMLKPETLAHLVDVHSQRKEDSTILTVLMENPAGYGRILRDDDGNLVKIIEQKDASPEQQQIKEVNVSTYCFEIPSLLEALDHLRTDNAQGEFYLTDVPSIMTSTGKKVGLALHDDAEELLGINSRVELADAERKLREKKVKELMISGVTIMDPSTTYIQQDVEIGQDTIIYPQVIIEGRTQIGSSSIIHSWSRLNNVTIGRGVTIRNSCVLEDCVVRDGATVGPFSRLRIGADIGEKAAIGNFVEVKKSKVGRGTKASHLTYLGDATLGDRVNIGAGTITCNYDGVRKNKTIIEDDVKIGSDTMLVAPVKVGHGSVTGAGTVVTKDIPPDSLAVGVPAVVKKKLRE